MATIEEQIAARKMQLGIEAQIAARKAQLAQGGSSSPQGNLAPGVAEAIAAAKAGTLQLSPERAAQQAAIDKPVEQQLRDPGIANTIATMGLQGMTLGWGDEALASGLNYMDPSTSRDEWLRRAQGQVADAQFSRPNTALASQIGGGIVALAPAVAAAPEMAGYSAVARIGAGMAAGGTLGAVQGAVQGAGEAHPGERAAGAVKGGFYGAGAGLFLGGLAPIASSVFRRVLTSLKGRDVSVIAKTLRVSPTAAMAVRDALQSDDFTAAAAALRRAGPDAMLADAGPATGQLLDSAAQSGGPANKIVQDAVNTRAEGAYQRLTTTLDQVMGHPDGVEGLAQKIAQRTAAQRKAAYDAAYASPIDYAAPTGHAIDEVVSRVPGDILDSAIKDANDLMQMGGKVNQQIKATIGANGKVTFSQPLNVEQLDMLKRSLDGIARESVNSIGRPTPMAAKARLMAGQLRSAIADAVPGYDTAVKYGGDKIAEDHALELGRGILNPAMTREDVKLGLGATPSREALQAAAKGARAAIDDALANVKATLANPSTDIKEAQKMVSDLSSRAAREKLSLILGSQAQRVFDNLDTAAKHLYLRGVVARGSQTAGRIAAHRAVTTAVNDGPIVAVKQGHALEVGPRIMQALTNTTPSAMIAKEKAVWDQISSALTAAKGPQAQAALVLIEKAAKGQPLSDAQAKMVARIVTGTGLLTVDQLTLQTLAMPSRGQ